MPPNVAFFITSNYPDFIEEIRSNMVSDPEECDVTQIK